MDVVNSITIEALTIGTNNNDQQESSVSHFLIIFYNYTYFRLQKITKNGVQMHIVCFYVSII